MSSDILPEDIDLALVYLQEFSDNHLDALLRLVYDSGQGADRAMYWLRAIIEAKRMHNL
jgi:hypothetical protein